MEKIGEWYRAAGRVYGAALAAWGVALAVLVGLDGSPFWRIVRVIVVLAVTAGLLWLAAVRPRPAAWLTFPCGVAGAAAGIAFGLRFLTVEGVSFTAVCGLAELAAGLVLLLVGVWRALRGLNRAVSIAGAAGLAVVLVVLTWAVTPAVMATNMPRVPAGKATPADYGLNARAVMLTAGDGVKLFAWYVAPAGGAVLVVRHGSGSTGADVLPQAAALARHGYGLLITDARGHGRSGGRAMDFGWYGDSDIRAAVDFLAAQPEVDPDRIGVVGFSMGGEEAIGALAGDERIKTVVAEGVTGRTEQDKAWLAAAYGWRGNVQRGLDWITYTLADLLTAARPPVSLKDALRPAGPRPVLLIAGGGVPDEARVADYLTAPKLENVTVWVAPGAGHTGAYAADPAQWERTVTGFLDGALAAAPAES